MFLYESLNSLEKGLIKYKYIRALDSLNKTHREPTKPVNQGGQ